MGAGLCCMNDDRASSQALKGQRDTSLESSNDSPFTQLTDSVPAKKTEHTPSIPGRDRPIGLRSISNPGAQCPTKRRPSVVAQTSFSTMVTQPQSVSAGGRTRYQGLGTIDEEDTQVRATQHFRSRTDDDNVDYGSMKNFKRFVLMQTT